MEESILRDFHPVVRGWFTRRFGQLTPAQALGWPSIAAGRNTLILAPTGSGKTLAAFLWAINHLVDQKVREKLAPGVRILYVSPLKALNNDIERNLREPLEGIRGEAERLGVSLPPLRAAVRTGDTPQAERARMVSHPPDILITTPESLYLMLTSARARAIFRSVQYVIVDEIHALCGNKRGVHLSLSLERLQEIAEQEFVRIGLSATQKPLETIAAYLGGQEPAEDEFRIPNPESRIQNAFLEENGEEQKRRPDIKGRGPSAKAGEGAQAEPTSVLRPRQVTIVDTGGRKGTDLRVSCPVADFSLLPEEGAWPAIYEELLEDIRTHRTTLVFVNNRRLAERIAARLNEMLTGEAESMVNLRAVPAVTDRRAADAAGPAREPDLVVQAYHGSMAREAREAMEAALKAGELRALIATSSLELGIDIGSIDLVVQIQSPKGVGRGLQRIGRSGHLVHAESKGRIIPTHREDLVEAAVVARAMLEHDVEPTAIPENCLDVLAQQITAMVAVEERQVDALYDLVRRSYCYRSLSRTLFDGVLGMLAGRYTEEAFRELRPRISWDKVNGVLRSLPGTSHLAITSGGTIADRGYFGVYLEDGKTRVGEVDEEFVYESRPGDTFILGSSVWRIADIDRNRVVVSPAPGQPARMPFWRGEGIGRSSVLGEKVGAFRRTLAGMIDRSDCLAWLERELPVDDNAAWNILEYFRRQRDVTGIIPHDRLLVVEAFRDEIGDPRLVVHSPFGRSVNGLLGLLLARRLRERTGIEAQMLYNDDGVLLRTSDRDELPLDLLDGVRAEEGRRVILEEVLSSPLFAGQFRQNAARALLMPKVAPGKRTPLWLQRMRAGDLLEIARRFEDFPIVLETMREVLHDVLDMERFLRLLEGIGAGEVGVHTVATETPSPFAAGLLFEFIAVYMYVYDRPRGSASGAPGSVSQELLAELVPGGAMAGFLRQEAIDTVERQLQHAAPGSQARSAEEFMQILLRLGDLSDSEAAERCAGDPGAMLGTLAAEGRIVRAQFPDGERWIAAEEQELYANLADEANVQRIIRRYLQNHGPVPRAALLRRYGLEPDRLTALEALWSTDRQLMRGRFRPGGGASEDEWCYRPNVERIHRQTIVILRKEITPVSLREFALFLQDWTLLTPPGRLQGEAGLESILDQFQGLPLPLEVWERDVLRPRVKGYAGELLTSLTRGGHLIWAGAGAGWIKPIGRGNGHLFPAQEQRESTEAERRILGYLGQHGASFFSDIRGGTMLSLEALNTALAGAFWAGRISNDAFEEIAALKRSTRSGEGPIDRVQMLDPRHNPRRARMMATVRRALKQVPGWSGRWFLMDSPGVRGESGGEEPAQLARQLLDRYGVVAREFLGREEMPPWGALAGVFQQMELRGEVRRGYFVEGLSGMQFALPEAADELRRLHERPAGGRRAGEGGVVLVAAADPANPYGSGVELPSAPGSAAVKVTRSAGQYLAFADGGPILFLEGSGARVTTIGQPDPSLVEAALRRFLDLMRLPEKLRPFGEVVIEYWDSQRPTESSFAGMLRRMGFKGDKDQTMRIDRYS